MSAKLLDGSRQYFTKDKTCDLLNWASKTCSLRCFYYGVKKTSGKTNAQLGNGKPKDSSCSKYITSNPEERNINLSEKRERKWKRLCKDSYNIYKHPFWEMLIMPFEDKCTLEAFLKKNFRRFKDPIFYFDGSSGEFRYREYRVKQNNLHILSNLDMMCLYLYLLRNPATQYNEVTGFTIKEDALLTLLRICSFSPFAEIADDIFQLFLPFTIKLNELEEDPWLIVDLLTSDDISKQLASFYKSLNDEGNYDYFPNAQEHIETNNELLEYLIQYGMVKNHNEAISSLFLIDRIDKLEILLEFEFLTSTPKSEEFRIPPIRIKKLWWSLKAPYASPLFKITNKRPSSVTTL